jgi:hypothetical protein
MVDPVADLIEMVNLFTQVATADPLSGISLAVGAIITGATVAFSGYLAAGAATAWVTQTLF